MSLTQELITLIRGKPISDQDLEKAALFSLDAIACAYAGSATGVGGFAHFMGLQPLAQEFRPHHVAARRRARRTARG